MRDASAFDTYAVCIVMDTEGAPTPEQHASLDALRDQGVRARLLAIPQGQTTATLRTLEYMSPELPDVVFVRALHAPVVIDPRVFRGSCLPLRDAWRSLERPGESELLVECLKHPSQVYVATRWHHLLPLAVAAEYHNATVVFQPAEPVRDAAPVYGGADELRQVATEQIAHALVRRVLVQAPEQLARFRAGFPRASTLVGPGEPARLAALLAGAARASGAPRDYLDEFPAERAALSERLAAGPPLLSIAIPTYNRAPLLLHTLSSVCAQARRYGLESLLEIVVSDNASSDGTAAAVRLCAQHTAIPVRYARSDTNHGVGHNVVRALELSSATFCCLLGDDDFVVEGALPALLASLLVAPDVSLVVFPAAGSARTAAAPTPLSLLDVAADWFYHVGNLGLAIVRRAHCTAPLASASRETLQRFWPQTQLYFLAMQASGTETPALLMPHVVVFHPLHRALTTYSARYLFDEGFFSLFDVALRLAQQLPGEFLPTIVTRYFIPRGHDIAEAMMKEYAEVDAPETARAALEAMRQALATCQDQRESLGDHADAVRTLIAVTMLRYAEASGALPFEEIVSMMEASQASAWSHAV